MFYSIGIDNGLEGAVVCIDSNMKVIDYFDTPIICSSKKKTRGKNTGKVSVSREFSPVSMAIRFEEMLKKCSKDVRIFLEQAQAMPKQGVSSTFKTGRGFGLWEGIIVGLCSHPYEIIHPRVWYEVIVKGVQGETTKARSLLKCQQLLPEIQLTKDRGRIPSLDGRSDAALIAYWGITQSRLKK